MKTALILVGGEGKRLYPLTKITPKPLIRMDDKPLLYWILIWLNQSGIENIILCVAYKPNEFMKFIRTIDLNLNILFSNHLVTDTNSIAIRKAFKFCKLKDEDFMVINGDTIANIDIKKFYQFHRRNTPLVSMAITPLLTNAGVVDTIGNRVILFREKPLVKNIMINSGYYIFNRKVLNCMDQQKIEFSLFSELVKIKQIYAYKHKGFWYTVDTNNDLVNFAKYKNEWQSFKDSVHKVY